MGRPCCHTLSGASTLHVPVSLVGLLQGQVWVLGSLCPAAGGTHEHAELTGSATTTGCISTFPPLFLHDCSRPGLGLLGYAMWLWFLLCGGWAFDVQSTSGLLCSLEGSTVRSSRGPGIGQGWWHWKKAHSYVQA